MFAPRYLRPEIDDEREEEDRRHPEGPEDRPEAEGRPEAGDGRDADHRGGGPGDPARDGHRRHHAEGEAAAEGEAGAEGEGDERPGRGGDGAGGGWPADDDRRDDRRDGRQ